MHAATGAVIIIIAGFLADPDRIGSGSHANQIFPAYPVSTGFPQLGKDRLVSVIMIGVISVIMVGVIGIIMISVVSIVIIGTIGVIGNIAIGIGTFLPVSIVHIGIINRIGWFLTIIGLGVGTGKNSQKGKYK